MSLPPPPPGTDLSESQVTRILAADISTWILAVIAVALRFLCRRLIGTKLWWDDWLMIPALISSAVSWLGYAVWAIPHGFGKHIWVADPDAGVVWAKVTILAEFAYTTALPCIKLSILCFYWRIFKHSSIRIPIYVLGVVVILWSIGVYITSAVECVPLKNFWLQMAPGADPSLRDSCHVDTKTFFVAISVPNIITDAAIVILPVPFVWRLQLRPLQRAALAGVFLLGIFVTGVLILRLTFVVRLNLESPDVTWNFVDTQVWTQVEMHVGIISACLPSLTPLLNYALNGTFRRFSGGGRETRSFRPSRNRHTHSFRRRIGVLSVDDDIGVFETINDQTRTQSLSTLTEYHSKESEPKDKSVHQVINVRTDIDVRSETAE